MQRMLTENPMNTWGNMHPLMYFDSIFDLDFGMISYIAEELLDPKVFIEEKFHRPVKMIVQELYCRKDKNPLVSFLQPDSVKDADALYSDIMTENRNELIDRSMITELYNMIPIFLTQSDISVSILVSTEHEEQVWRETTKDDSKLSNIAIYYRDKLDEKTVNQIQQVFCKYPADVLSSSVPILHKSIYLAGYSFTFDEDPVREQELELLSFRNTINRIDLYKRSIIGGPPNGVE